MKPSKRSQNKRAFSTAAAKPAIPLIKYLYSSLTMSILTILAVLLSQKSLPPQIPLFYGLPEGEEQLTTSFGLIIPGVVSLIVAGINTLISLLLDNQFLQKSLILTSLAISAFSLVTTLKIILLVGSF